MIDITVVVLVYNHEKYIGQAIESVLAQKTSYSLEVLVGEDNSTDSSKEIVLKYQKAHPDLIKVFFPDINKKIYVSGHPTGRWNFINLLNHAQGKYIAILDGDDYWMDPLKLQKQVDFLEAHPDFSICHSKVKIINETNEEDFTLSPEEEEITTIEDLCRGNFIRTPTTVYRNGLIKNFPDWYYKCLPGDWPLHLLNAEHGKIKYFKEPMAVYRKHAGGLWTKHTEISSLKNMIRTAKFCNKHFKYKYKYYFYSGIVSYYQRLKELCAGIKPLSAFYYHMMFNLTKVQIKLSMPNKNKA